MKVGSQENCDKKDDEEDSVLQEMVHFTLLFAGIDAESFQVMSKSSNVPVLNKCIQQVQKGADAFDKYKIKSEKQGADGVDACNRNTYFEWHTLY